MSDEQSMIERVAMAILASIDQEEVYLGRGDIAETITVDGHVPFLVLARAAIKEMREPTKPMVEAGAVSCGENSEVTAIGAWEGMIDAALNEHANAR